MNSNISPTMHCNESEIAVLSYDNYLASAIVHRARRVGFPKATIISEKQLHLANIKESDLVLFVVQSSESSQKTIHEIHSLRIRGFDKAVAVLSSSPTLKECCDSFRAGADDYLIKGRFLDLEGSLLQLLRNVGPSAPDTQRKMPLREKSFLKSMGLTEMEVRVLVEYAKDYPRQGELADRMNKSGQQLRKVFSRIYEKLDDPLNVNNIGRLAHLLTVCTTSERL